MRRNRNLRSLRVPAIQPARGALVGSAQDERHLRLTELQPLHGRSSLRGPCPQNEKIPAQTGPAFHEQASCVGTSEFDLTVRGTHKALLVSERALAASQCEVVVGAGTGFEPVTFRL